MKRFSLIKVFLFAAFAAFFYTSCDTTGGGSTGAPILELRSGTTTNGGAYVTSDVDVTAGSTISLNISGLSGDVDMSSIKFYVDGVAETAANLTYDGTAAWANPALLSGTDAQSFNWIVDWVVHAGESVKTYTVEITDANQNTDAVAFLVNTVPDTPPTPLALSFIETTPYIWADATVPANTFFKIGLTATRGDTYPLFTLAVLEDNVAIADFANRLRYNGLDFTSNPSGLPVGDEQGFTAEILVKAHATEGLTKTYTFVVADENGDEVSVMLDITTEVTGTPISSSISGALLNAAGPAGTGGLDLDSGTGMGSNDTDAEIKDLGIDQSLPNDQNWRRQIAATNNAVLRSASTAPEFAVNFSTVQFTEEIVDAYNNGTDVSLGSQAVQIGDVFIVERNGTYYLIQCTNYTETAADNADQYEFAIKF